MASDVSVPKNAVLAGMSHIARRKPLRVKTVTNVRPGRLVVYDTDDDHFKVAAANAVHGILGWAEKNYTNPAWDGASDPTAEDEFSIIRGPGVPVKARLASGENVKRGDLLVPAANGELKKATTLNIPSGVTSVTSTVANGEIIAGSVPKDGRVVAEAEHDVDATAEAKDIVVTSLI